jgi:hypothetical protein
MRMESEVARFRPDEPDAVVQASFACSYCLHEPSVAVADHGDGGSAVACRCDRCVVDWVVLLTDEQSLRIQLRPPWAGMNTVFHVA